jgi:hypothetical protein
VELCTLPRAAAAALGPVTRRAMPTMHRRTGLFVIALAAALQSVAASPSRAADEPVATAPIPPPAPSATPLLVPLAPHVAAAPAKATPPKTTHSASREQKHAKTEHRKPAVRHLAATAAKHAEQRTSRHRAPERRVERQEANAGREPPRAVPEYRPRRYYYREEVVGPPFPPPPWYNRGYDRGPPFAAMPHPRGMMPPW